MRHNNRKRRLNREFLFWPHFHGIRLFGQIYFGGNMKKTLTGTLVAMAVSSMPLATISATALAFSAEIALAKDKSDKPGKPEDKGKEKSKPEKGQGNGSTASALKGMNSLKRNINGLMNSSDPKREGFRSYIPANAALLAAQADLETAQGEYDLALENYMSLSLSGVAADDLANLIAALEGLSAPDPATATEEELAAYQSQLAHLTQSIETVNAFIQETAELALVNQLATEALEGTTEEDMIEAFVAGMVSSGQSDFTAEDITPEMMALLQAQMDALVGAYTGQ